PGTLLRNTARPSVNRVPDVGIYATLKRLRRPRHADGFDELYAVRIDGTGGFTVTPIEEDREEEPGDASARP
ncbi:hypothetical protein ACFQ07_00935, partial [Actinomadura adrarensis]